MSRSFNASDKYKPRILKEGFLEKKTTVLKKWRRRYFKLNGEVLCFFKKEDKTNSTRPMGRIFLADILTIAKHFSKAKGKDNCFSLDTKSGKTHVMNGATEAELDAWILILKFAKDDFFKQEESDPVRRRSIKLNGDLKRIKLFKDPTKGIGVRIKSVNGCVFVTRIVEDGPVAETGVLRPGDQILDVDGVDVNNMSIEQVSEVLKAAPILMACTVKPASHFRYCQTEQTEQKNSSYAEIDIDALAATNTALSMTPDYEEDHLSNSEDQSSNCSDSYVIPIPSDEDQSSEHLYDEPTPETENTKEDDENEYYVNLPEKPKEEPKPAVLPPGQRNYLELCFDDAN